MTFFVVSYDLRKKDEFDYEDLWAAFKQLDSVKCQESVYLVSSGNTARQVKAHFRARMHNDDLLIVIEFSMKPSFHRALGGTQVWIKSHWD